MLLRNVNERLQIINRKSCKNEMTYNQKLYKVRLEYMQKYKSVVLICSKPLEIKPEGRSGSKPEGQSGSKEPLDSE
jgi:hypothetical protein